MNNENSRYPTYNIYIQRHLHTKHSKLLFHPPPPNLHLARNLSHRRNINEGKKIKTTPQRNSPRVEHTNAITSRSRHVDSRMSQHCYRHGISATRRCSPESVALGVSPRGDLTSSPQPCTVGWRSTLESTDESLLG